MCRVHLQTHNLIFGNEWRMGNPGKGGIPCITEFARGVEIRLASQIK
jgi:hypothetical protein